MNVRTLLLVALFPWAARAEPGAGEPLQAVPFNEAEEAESRAHEFFLTRASGLVQVDFVPFRESSVNELDPATRAPLNEERFLLRRALFRVDSRGKWAGARVELEASTLSGPTIRPRQAWLEVFTKRENFYGLALRGRLGLIQIPFGGDAQMPLTVLPWLERSTFVRAFFPGQHDFGASLEAEYDVLRLSIAAMNGEPIGEAGFPGLDPGDQKDVVGRSGVDLRLPGRGRFQVGTSWLFGTGLHEGQPATKDGLSWRDNNENGLVEVSELRAAPGSSGTPSAPFSRFALGADLRLILDIPALGLLLLQAEIARAANLDRGVEVADPVARGRDLRELGFALGVSQEFFEHLSVSLRYDEYNPDSDALRSSGIAVVPRDATYRTLAAAVSVRFDRLRLLLEYDHRQNHLGVDDSGAPTTLRDDALTLRGEYALP